MVSEYGHLHLRIESLVNFLIAATSLFHHAITLALGLAAIKNRSHLLCRQIAVGSVGFPPVFLLKLRLQIMSHVVIHGLLGKLLHAAIDSSIYFQAVSIEIIGLAILIPVFVAPSIQGVCLPSDAVIDILILVPAGIARLVIPVRSLGHHVETQEFPEIGSRSIFVVNAMEIQLQRFHPFLVILRLGKISHFQHLGQHHVTPLAGTLRIAHGVEKGRILAKSHQRGALADVKLGRLQVLAAVLMPSAPCKKLK